MHRGNETMTHRNDQIMTVRDLGDIAHAAGILPSELIAVCELRRAASTHED